MSAPSSDRAAIRQTLRALKAAGYSPVTVNDGEETIKVWGATEAEVIEALTATDQAWLYVTAAAGPRGKQSWVFFVLGNDPEEVINDYTVDLDPVIDPLYEKWGII